MSSQKESSHLTEEICRSISSLVKGFAHGPLSLHPWQIELEFRIHALLVSIGCSYYKLRPIKSPLTKDHGNITCMQSKCKLWAQPFYIYLNTKQLKTPIGQKWCHLCSLGLWKPLDGDPRELQNQAQSAKGEERGDRERNLWLAKMVDQRSHRSFQSE